MEGIVLYEALERKIDELLSHTRQFQDSHRQLESQLQEKERLFQQQAILIEQLQAERDEVRRRVERLIAHIEEKVEDQRKAAR
jgi:peptidoglycan hydrolase CwlO-like protein